MIHSTPLLRKDGLYLAHTETKGRGLFCSHAITAGEELEVTPAIILTEDETLETDNTILRDYVFRIGDLSQEALDNLGIKDAELAKFYHELMVSEAGHYTTFLNFARKYTIDVDVDKRWKEWLEFEGELIQSFGNKEAIHG